MPSQTPAHAASDSSDAGVPESFADESEPEPEPEYNSHSASQRPRKRTVAFELYDEPETAPWPGRSRPVAWDKGRTGEYQEEVPMATLGREPRVARNQCHREVPRPALDREHYQQEVFADDRWVIPESGSSGRFRQKKGSKPLKYYSVVSNHTPNTQKVLKTSNEAFRQIIAARVTFPMDEELENLSKKCFDQGLANFRQTNGSTPG